MLEVVVAGLFEKIVSVIQAGWDAAQTTRVNREVHRGALGGRVNELLDAERADLFARGEFQARNSSLLEGVIKTYESFLAGKMGPKLQLLSGDKAWNDAAEGVWRRWWAVCDYDGISSDADKLALWVVQLWKYGEFFEQLVNDGEGPADLPQLRLRSVHPERVETDAMVALMTYGASGVILDSTGRRTGFRVREELPGRIIAKHFTVNAGDMLHYFEPTEPGQLRGVPWMASALPVIGDIRELDKSVLAAMRLSADLAGVMETQPGSGDFVVEPVELDDSTNVEIRRNQLTKMPQGWTMKQLKPEQPGLNHKEYRHDRLRELGRGRGLSLLHVLADGSQHNYSSMRGDNQMLDMVLGTDRGKLERKVLTRLVMAVLREAVLMGLIDPVPGDVRVSWIWPQREFIDPQKEAQGQILALEAGTKTMHEVCAERGVDYEEHVAVLEAEVKDLEARGLVHPTQRAAAESGMGAQMVGQEVV